jgi:hypothetical protein
LFIESANSTATNFGLGGQFHEMYGLTPDVSVGGVAEINLIPQGSGGGLLAPRSDRGES